MNFDWSKPMVIDWSGKSGPFFTKEDIENCVIKRVINNTYCAPFCEREYIRQIPWWNPHDPFGTGSVGKSLKHRKFIPGQQPLPAYPQVSTLTQEQHHQAVRVLSAKYKNVQPHQYAQPSEMDYLAFEEIKELYETEQKEFLKWAKLLWLNGGCIRALRPKPIIEQVYEAEFKMRAHEVKSLPQNYVLAAQIPLESDRVETRQSFELEHAADLLNVNIQDLPIADYPEVMEKPLSVLLKSCSMPEPCNEHICKFVLPHEKSMSSLPMSEIYRELANFAITHDCTIIADENALRSLLETDQRWNIPVSVIQTRPDHGDYRSVVVLGEGFDIRKTCATQRTYRAYKQMMLKTFVSSFAQHEQSLNTNTETSKPGKNTEIKEMGHKDDVDKRLLNRSEPNGPQVDKTIDSDLEVYNVGDDLSDHDFNKSDEELSSDTDRLVIADPIAPNENNNASITPVHHNERNSTLNSESSTSKEFTPILLKTNKDADTILLDGNKNTALKPSNVTPNLSETNIDPTPLVKNLKTSITVFSDKPMTSHETGKISSSPTKYIPLVNPSSFEIKTGEATSLNKLTESDTNASEVIKVKTLYPRVMMRKPRGGKSFAKCDETVVITKTLDVNAAKNNANHKEPSWGDTSTWPNAGKRANTLLDQVYLDHDYAKLRTETLESTETLLGVSNSKASFDEPDNNRSSHGDNKKVTIDNIDSISKPGIENQSFSAPATAISKSKTSYSTDTNLVTNEVCNKPKSSTVNKPGKINLCELFGDDSDSDEPIHNTTECNKLSNAKKENITEPSHHLKTFVSSELDAETNNTILDSNKDILGITNIYNRKLNNAKKENSTEPSHLLKTLTLIEPNVETTDSISDSNKDILDTTKVYNKKLSSNYPVSELRSIKKSPVKPSLGKTSLDECRSTNKIKLSGPTANGSDYTSISGSDSEEDIIGFHKNVAVPASHRLKSSKKQKNKMNKMNTPTCIYSLRSRKNTNKGNSKKSKSSDTNKKENVAQRGWMSCSTSDESDISIQKHTNTKKVTLRRSRRLSTRLQTVNNDKPHKKTTNEPIKGEVIKLDVSERTRRFLRRTLNDDSSDSDQSGDQMSEGTRNYLRGSSSSNCLSDAESDTEMNIFHFSINKTNDTDSDSSDENSLTIDCSQPERTEEKQVTEMSGHKTNKESQPETSSTVGETSNISPVKTHAQVETKQVDATRTVLETNSNRKLSNSEHLHFNEQLKHINTLSKDAVCDIIGVNRCTCTGTKLDVPPRSFKKWRLNNTEHNSQNIIIHSSHKCRKGENEVLLEPIVEFQPELGGTRQSAGKIRALTLSLMMRKSAKLVNVHINHENGEVMVIDEMSKADFIERNGDKQSDVANTLHTVLDQLRYLLPGQYVLAHEPSHGTNAMLYTTKGLSSVHESGNAGQTLSLHRDNINMPDAEEAIFAKTPPDLAPVLFPYHKYRGILPLAFSPHNYHVKATKKIKSALARGKPPPQAIKSNGGATNAAGTPKWPTKKKPRKPRKPRQMRPKPEIEI